ncbi:hypothetical protein DFH28DRAFT_1119469 [Melampsora americana]|nr:hypothetical protein DFH28DRAFT_1119469 [Melampsora americana]
MSTRKGGNNIAYKCPHLRTCFDPNSKGKPCQDCNGLNLTGVRNHTLNTKHHKFCAPECPVYKLTDLSQVKFERKKFPKKIDLPVQSTVARVPSSRRSSSPSPLARKTSNIYQIQSLREPDSPPNKDCSPEFSFRQRPVPSTSTCTLAQEEFPDKGATVIIPQKVTFLDSHHHLSNYSSSTRETSEDLDTLPKTSTRTTFKEHLTSEVSPPGVSPHQDRFEKFQAESIGPDSNRLHVSRDSQKFHDPRPLVGEFSSRDPLLPIPNSRCEEPFRLDWKLAALVAAFLFNLFWFIRACIDDSSDQTGGSRIKY